MPKDQTIDKVIAELITTLQYGIDREGQVDEQVWRNQLKTNLKSVWEAGKVEAILGHEHLTEAHERWKQEGRVAALDEAIAAVESLLLVKQKFWDRYFLGGEDSKEIKAMNKNRQENLKEILEALITLKQNK